ncbi:hypothetical protein I3F58_22750 [Streptomyces sp. MUM 203J]|uniref:hypothetical protein n=1 Tax=Streptomyces sp. MUM 203J TaxID=2791990 RepID=UPI001F043E27|nr:hypothetical protein [Streptomyces sp. MUM 203J]MCH0542318.1 hypothetical protein [Streptomyces sp. MUM 203J]
MTATNGPVTEPGFVTFGMLRTASPQAARELVGLITAEVTRWVRHTDGFLSARTHVGVDGTTVVQSGLWASEEHYLASFPHHPEGSVLHTLSERPEVLSARVCSGVPAAGVRGPAADRAPGLVGFAVRRLDGPGSARTVLGLLARSGRWKRTSPGFVSATPYVSRDGTTFVNCPMWVDEEAYDSYMGHPDLHEGLEEVSRLETAPPAFLLCTVAADIGAPGQSR